MKYIEVNQFEEKPILGCHLISPTLTTIKVLKRVGLKLHV